MPEPEPFRIITFDELNDAIESLVLIAFSDDELAGHGIQLSGKDTLFEGLGPCSFTLIELRGGRQYLLHRYEGVPESLNIAGSVSDDRETMVDGILSALQVPDDRITWTESSEYWDQMRAAYDRSEWQTRRHRTA